MTFTLAELSTTTEATYDLELVHPVVGPTCLFVTHKSATAPDVEAFARKQGNASLKKTFKAQRARANKADDEAPTIEENVERAAALLAFGTVAWFEMKRDKAGNIDPTSRVEGWPNGKDRLMFSLEAAERLYSDPGYRWAREQVDESMVELDRFLQK